MATDKLSINNLLMDNIPVELQSEVTATQLAIDPQRPDLTGTPDPEM
jgi:hypothetical protein